MNYLRQPESLVCEITESQNPDIHAAKRIRELLVVVVQFELAGRAGRVAFGSDFSSSPMISSTLQM